MTQIHKPRGCAIDNAPQVFIVGQIGDAKETRDGYFKNEVIVMYNRWLDHRCRCDRLNHPKCKFGIKVAVDTDLKALESLPNDIKYIVRFRAKRFAYIKTKKYGKVKTLFGSTLKVYFKYNIFQGVKL